MRRAHDNDSPNLRYYHITHSQRTTVITQTCSAPSVISVRNDHGKCQGEIFPHASEARGEGRVKFRLAHSRSWQLHREAAGRATPLGREGVSGDQATYMDRNGRIYLTIVIHDVGRRLSPEEQQRQRRSA